MTLLADTSKNFFCFEDKISYKIKYEPIINIVGDQIWRFSGAVNCLRYACRWTVVKWEMEIVRSTGTWPGLLGTNWADENLYTTPQFSGSGTECSQNELQNNMYLFFSPQNLRSKRHLWFLSLLANWVKSKGDMKYSCWSPHLKKNLSYTYSVKCLTGQYSCVHLIIDHTLMVYPILFYYFFCKFVMFNLYFHYIWYFKTYSKRVKTYLRSSGPFKPYGHIQMLKTQKEIVNFRLKAQSN